MLSLNMFNVNVTELLHYYENQFEIVDRRFKGIFIWQVLYNSYGFLTEKFVFRKKYTLLITKSYAVGWLQ